MGSNHYTSELREETNTPLGGTQWWPLSREELKALLVVNLLIGIKRLPNYCNYWSRANQFLYCPNISNIMTCHPYEDITKCLHIADDTMTMLAGDNAKFDKLWKMRWLPTKIKRRFKCNWNLNQQVIVDETMVPYKRKYCLVCQYMSKKPTK